MDKVVSVEQVSPEPARCISVDSEDRLYMVDNEDGKGIANHNSVSQRNITFGTIMRPDNWYFLGIDLKRVELSCYRPYSNVVLRIATELPDALDVLRFGSQTMMKRYDMMEKVGVQNFIDLPNPGKALLIMVDEFGELVSPQKGKALSGDTRVLMANGELTCIADVVPGDEILDPNYDVSYVVEKYQPFDQTHHKVKVKRCSNGHEEDIHSGGQHLWTIYYQYSNGEKEGPFVEGTAYIQEFIEKQKKRPRKERVKVMMKRSKAVKA